MNITNQNSYLASPSWRWQYYNNSLLLQQLLPTRENHDTFKIFKKSS
jgi:hypothetical protein